MNKIIFLVIGLLMSNSVFALGMYGYSDPMYSRSYNDPIYGRNDPIYNANMNDPIYSANRTDPIYSRYYNGYYPQYPQAPRPQGYLRW